MAQTYRELRNLAGAEELDARGTDELERRALRLEGAAGHLCDVYAELGTGTGVTPRELLEGRLESLIRPLELLAQAIDHPSVRTQA